MALRSKFFKAGTAGKTADGRVIKDQWLIDIAGAFDRKEREASVFLDHDTVYGNYGSVANVSLRKDEKGRNALWLQIEPTPDLIKLNKRNQYTYPSLGVIEDFAGTGKAYLGHLGAVQDPASVGTETINYSNGDGTQSEVLCFACEDSVTFELEPKQATDNNDIPKWFKSFFKKYTQQDSDMDTQLLNDLKKDMAEFRTVLDTLKKPHEKDETTPDTVNYSQEIQELKDQIIEFKKLLDNNAPENNGNDEKFKALERKFEAFSTKLDDALKENDDTPTPPHSGGDINFSVDSLV